MTELDEEAKEYLMKHIQEAEEIIQNDKALVVSQDVEREVDPVFNRKTVGGFIVGPTTKTLEIETPEKKLKIEVTER